MTRGFLLKTLKFAVINSAGQKKVERLSIWQYIDDMK